MNIADSVKKIAADALAASRLLSRCPTGEKNEVLTRMAEELLRNRDRILSANQRDVTAAREKGLSAAMIDRLTVKDATLAAMARGLREVAALPDPVGKVTSMWRRPNGLLVGRMRIPLGVIGIQHRAHAVGQLIAPFLSTSTASSSPLRNALTAACGAICRNTRRSSLPGLPHHLGLRLKTTVPALRS